MDLRFLFICLFVLGFCTDSYSAQKESIQVFDLVSAVRYTIDHSPKLDSFRRDLYISELNLKNSLASFAPSVDVSSSHTINKTESRDIQKSSDLGVNLSQNLYNNNKDITNYKINKLRHNIVKTTYKDERDKIIKKVAVNFLNLSLQRGLYKVQELNLKTVKKEYKSASKKYRNGLSTKKDVERFYTQIQLLEIKLLQSRNRIDQTKKQLLTDMGYDLLKNPVTYVKIKTINLPDVDIATIPTITPILKYQPQYKNILFQKKIDRLNVYLTKRNYWPQIDVSAGVSYGAGADGLLGSIESKKNWDSSVSLVLSYNIFDAGTKKREITIAREQEQKSSNEQYSQLLNLKQAIDNLMLDLKQNKLSYQLSGKLRRSELKNYQTIEKMYRNGKIEYLDLSAAINDLFSARAKHISDRYALESNLYSYYYYKGNIYEKVFK